MPAKKKNHSLSKSLSEFIFDPQIFPLFLTFTVFGLLFVLFRMKGVEQEYQLSNLNKRAVNVSLNLKELKAERAKLLSVKNLRQYAQQYGLAQPKQKQIIVIP